VESPFDKLLVLDLDETLVHTVSRRHVEDVGRAPDFEIDAEHVVYRRPHVQEFLEWCLTRFADVGVWTAGTRPYALEVLPHVCDHDSLSFIWGRDRCTWHRNFDVETEGLWSEGHWLKDVRKLRRLGYARAKTICVDDTPMNFKRSYGNCVPVPSYTGSEDDDLLPKLRRYLEELGPLSDVRPPEKRAWWLRSRER
jgi:RNA polymerase II subunit A small phosphatase-like protein